jgi:F420H(2)-dependent quinone reductase
VYHESGNKEIGEEIIVPEYIPSPRQWVRDQVELYEGSGGKEGTTLRDTGLPVIIVTHTGNKTGAVRKTPLMRVKDGANYVLVGPRRRCALGIWSQERCLRRVQFSWEGAPRTARTSLARP